MKWYHVIQNPGSMLHVSLVPDHVFLPAFIAAIFYEKKGVGRNTVSTTS